MALSLPTFKHSLNRSSNYQIEQKTVFSARSIIFACSSRKQWQSKRMQARLAFLAMNSEPLVRGLGALPSPNLTARKLDFKFNTVFYRITPALSLD